VSCATAQQVQAVIEVFDYDAELSRYHVRLRAAAGVRAADRVLDIGCGAGLTTRDAARLAATGSALGVDLSPTMVKRARELSRQERIPNVSFEMADAESHAFAPRDFTLALSRFGTMFFADPLAAFINIRQALQPGARLVQLVWQAHGHQEWSTAIRHALLGTETQEVSTGLGVAAFSLADPSVVAGVLTTAGFTKVEITDVREPVYYGPDAASAFNALSDLRMTADLVTDQDLTEKARALERLLTMLDAHDTSEGVWFDSRAWLVTAVRR
jgi:SAM-dependent methyltransferase